MRDMNTSDKIMGNRGGPSVAPSSQPMRSEVLKRLDHVAVYCGKFWRQ